MNRMKSLAGNFLIASPGLDDPNFSRAVVLMCDHTEEGAFGLVINRVIMPSFLPLMENLKMQKNSVDMPVYFGGPVRPEQGHIIYSPHSRKYGSLRVAKNIAVSASMELLHDIAEGKGPERYIFTLGFSGWSALQLEAELMTDSWLIAPADSSIIFSVRPNDRWRSAGSLIDVDFFRYSERSGNA
jgi:putative transcriptional regulator